MDDQKLNILIVDDDNVQLLLMKELLLHYPVKVTTEINSALVLQRLEADNYDLVLTDVQMPVKGGFELVKQIRQHTSPVINALPVIALSGKRDLSAEDYLSRGFTAHHTKPVQLEQLLELVTGIFSDNLPPDQVGHPEEKTSKSFYNLSSLSQFTYNDPESLKEILETFIVSAKENCNALREAAFVNDTDTVAQLAHKMIPMLRQMEVHSIVQKLLPLEDRSIILTHNELSEYTEDVCGNVTKLCEKLEGEMV